MLVLILPTFDGHGSYAGGDAVVMIEQFRVGAIEDQRSAWLLEIVAGLIEPGELPEEVARREAAEEAGLAVRRIELIARCFATPSKSSELTQLFCGEVDAPRAPAPRLV
jgi:ADP-ribose pyrophosphatase